jgi:hypothetical protein
LIKGYVSYKPPLKQGFLQRKLQTVAITANHK